MATTKNDARLRVAVTLDGDEAAAIARAARAAGLRPATWARAALLKAAEHAEPVVTARAERLLRELENAVGGKAHAAELTQHQREGWARGRR